MGSRCGHGGLCPGRQRTSQTAGRALFAKAGQCLQAGGTLSGAAVGVEAAAGQLQHIGLLGLFGLLDPAGQARQAGFHIQPGRQLRPVEHQFTAFPAVGKFAGLGHSLRMAGDGPPGQPSQRVAGAVGAQVAEIIAAMLMLLGMAGGIMGLGQGAGRILGGRPGQHAGGQNGGDGDDTPDSMMEAATSAEAPSILNLRRMSVDDVAVTKADIVAVPVTVGLLELVEVFREHGYSRVPVYRGNLDQPLGLVHLKDLALKHGFAPKGAPRFALRPLLRPLLYVPGSMPIGALLQQMQQKRIHMALVIDEYGGVDGLVTIEDLIEQVIGEIDDEHDESEDGLWVQERPGQWLVLARAPIDRVEAEIGGDLTIEAAQAEMAANA